MITTTLDDHQNIVLLLPSYYPSTLVESSKSSDLLAMISITISPKMAKYGTKKKILLFATTNFFRIAEDDRKGIINQSPLRFSSVVKHTINNAKMRYQVLEY